MRLRDFRPRTRGHTLAVRQFMDSYGARARGHHRGDVRAYFLYLREDKKLAPSTINIALYGSSFFFIHTCSASGGLRHPPRPQAAYAPGRPEPERGARRTRAVRHPVRRMALATIYALGLRLNEGLAARDGHIDGRASWCGCAMARAPRTAASRSPARCSAACAGTGRPSARVVHIVLRRPPPARRHPRATLQKTFSAAAQGCPHQEGCFDPHAASQLRDPSPRSRRLAPTIKQVLGHKSIQRPRRSTCTSRSPASSASRRPSIASWSTCSARPSHAPPRRRLRGTRPTT